jgi:broad specificity phosphatase PhoE
MIYTLYSMFLILLRHGDKLRSHTDPNMDLSLQGLEQAQRLVELRETQFPTPQVIYSSPKKRAVSTVSPLAKSLGLKPQIHPDLDEQSSGESRRDLDRRITGFLNSVTSRSGTVLACSHADWLAQAVHLMPSTLLEPDFEAHFHMAQFRVFEFDGVLWHYLPNYGRGR